MGKRSNFERREKDFYPTPPAAVAPLLRRLPHRVRYCEPCAGDGALIRELALAGHVCASAWDITPRSAGIEERDALSHTPPIKPGDFDFFITNPPWSRNILHPLITHLTAQRPAWLLIDADWAHTKQAVPFLPWCAEIVAVGRVKWIPGSPHAGQDNVAWHLFDRGALQTRFFGRAA